MNKKQTEGKCRFSVAIKLVHFITGMLFHHMSIQNAENENKKTFFKFSSRGYWITTNLKILMILSICASYFLWVLFH